MDVGAAVAIVGAGIAVSTLLKAVGNSFLGKRAESIEIIRDGQTVTLNYNRPADAEAIIEIYKRLALDAEIDPRVVSTNDHSAAAEAEDS